MKKIKKVTLVMLCLSMFILAACSSDKKEDETTQTSTQNNQTQEPQVEEMVTEEEVVGEPFIVKVGGMEITPGTTLLQAVEDQGYMVSDTSGQEIVHGEDGSIDFAYAAFADLTMMAEPMTTYIGAVIVKDGKSLASLTVENISEEEIPLGECIITSVTIARSDDESETSSVSGIGFSELSLEKIREAFGEESYGSVEETYIGWERAEYSLEIYVDENGDIDNFTSRCIL